MDIEKQVVSLDLAKKLKEAGYPQDYENCTWQWAKQKDHKQCTLWNECDISEFQTDDFVEQYNAPTVAELGEKLPTYVCSYRYNSGYACEYSEHEVVWKFDAFYREAKTEADARAEAWLYLKEKGLLK